MKIPNPKQITIQKSQIRNLKPRASSLAPFARSQRQVEDRGAQQLTLRVDAQ
jgi:hypothetical protein